MVGRDITHLKRAEKALHEFNETLSRAVQGRTAELVAANRELEERARQLRLLAGELTMTEQRERKQLSKILHDGLQQYLVAAKMQVAVLTGESNDFAREETVSTLESLLGESIRVSRSLAAELSPPILHDGGILAGIEWLTRWMSGKHGLRVDLAVEIDSPVLLEDVKVFLFEAVRELLLNVVKHARADSARVHLAQDGQNHLIITVSDSGEGFDPQKTLAVNEGSGGFGLFSIRERISLLRGRLEVDSSPGKGASFSLIVPLGLSKT